MGTRLKKVWASDEQVAHMDYVFKEAARTDKLLPPLTNKKISNSWLDIPPDWTSYGWDKDATVRMSASRHQIDNYDKALETGLKLSREDRKLIWSVALSMANKSYGTWTRLSKKFRCDRRTVQSNYRGALIKAWIVYNE
tara:strand:- start:281 stop:697 length:417 start_codon:yes stop_codon:yes gene_type:complete